MSAAQVAKLEALLARVQSRRLEPGLRLVDAAAVEPEPTPVNEATVASPEHAAPSSARVAVATPPVPIERAAPAPQPEAAAPQPELTPAPQAEPTPVAASLLTLDEPELDEPAVSAVPASPPAAGTHRVTMDVDPAEDDLIDVVEDAPEPPAPPRLELVEPEDALVTAVARPAPVVDLDEPTAPAAVEPIPTPPSGLQAAGPVVMQAPVPVASGPVASFEGAPQRTHALSFGELVGLAMSLTTR